MKVIAIDLDGTLLSKEGVISGENKKAIKEAQRKGHVVSICTGRDIDDVRRLLQMADLDCPIIAGNGAIVSVDGAIVNSTPLIHGEALEILHQIEKQEIFYHVYTNEGIFAPKNGEKSVAVELDIFKSANPEADEEELKNVAKMYLHQFGLNTIDSAAALKSESLEFFKILPFSYQTKKMEDLRKSLLKNPNLAVTSSADHNLEINHIDATKGNGLAQLANHFNIPMKDTVAIGDNLNDVSMLKTAGLAIAMGNALDEIKELAHQTTLTNDEDGVAFALRKYVITENE
ncbi:Cof-type HAD-IIB family hydrolase [Fictibacillus gelatini]|uniref:Cof-type HAD-IIB family hydrolase n=1 Tax=Fictibacillus gelatini TaxID=225985 RepID=UPI000478B48A|nr:Cof-type HAD-IIB family hydrolase [Fictibacillus gelatini]